MAGELTAVVDDLRAAQQGIHALYASLPAASWHDQPGANRWSAAECLVHLNMTSAALIPLLRRGLDEARATGSRVRGYRRNFMGWLVSKAIGPRSLVRIATVPAFVPDVTQSIAELIDEFDRLQDEIVACVEAGHGLPLDRVSLVSPFHARLRYNVYAAMTLIPRHQHRHLQQAAAAASAPEQLVPALAI